MRHRKLGRRFSRDSGLVFERPSRWLGENLTQTLEPRLFYVWVPYRNQDHVPLFDTTLADFNYATLFTENRFVGVEPVEGRPGGRAGPPGGQFPGR